MDPTSQLTIFPREWCRMNGTVLKKRVSECNWSFRMNGTELCRMNGTVWKKTSMWKGSYVGIYFPPCSVLSITERIRTNNESLQNETRKLKHTYTNFVSRYIYNMPTIVVLAAKFNYPPFRYKTEHLASRNVTNALCSRKMVVNSALVIIFGTDTNTLWKNFNILYGSSFLVGLIK